MRRRERDLGRRAPELDGARAGDHGEAERIPALRARAHVRASARTGPPDRGPAPRPWRTFAWVGAGIATAGLIFAVPGGLALLRPRTAPPGCRQGACGRGPAAQGRQTPEAAPSGRAVSSAPHPAAPDVPAGPGGPGPASASPDRPLGEVVACLTANGLALRTATWDAGNPAAHGALLDACRADASYRTPAAPAPIPADAETCYIPAGSRTATCPPAATVSIPAGPAPASCPPPLTGRFTLNGLRAALRVTVGGPDGSRTLGVYVDTGGTDTQLPAAVLQALGYRPFAEQTALGIVPGATERVGLYDLPASDLTVADDGRTAPLATGTLIVMGAPPGAPSSLGPDLLEQGMQFQAGGGRWALTPACPPDGQRPRRGDDEEAVRRRPACQRLSETARRGVAAHDRAHPRRV